MSRKKKINSRDLFLLSLRSFFVQSSWNFNKMQGLGFLYMVEGSLKKIHGDSESLKNVLKKHTDFFNTNPYFSSAIAGAVVKYEEEAFVSGFSEEDPESVKASLMGPFGAIGDSLFWATLRPLVSVAAVIAALASSYLAPFLFLFLYGAPSIAFRFYVAFMGYKYGKNIIFKFRELNIFNLINRLKNIMALLLGAILPLLSINYDFRLSESHFYLNILIVFIAVNIGFIVFLRRLTTTAVICILLFSCILYQYILPF